MILRRDARRKYVASLSPLVVGSITHRPRGTNRTVAPVQNGNVNAYTYTRMDCNAEIEPTRMPYRFPIVPARIRIRVRRRRVDLVYRARSGRIHTGEAARTAIVG